jgi:hypothetical protein
VEIEWWSVDFKTGQRVGILNVQSSGKLARFIGLGTDATVSVRCSHDGVEIPGWDEATAPGRSLLVAVDKDGDHVVWGGLVRRRTSGEGPWVQCSVDSLEKYLNRRYINQQFSWTDADASTIAADVLAPIAAGLAPLTVDATPTGNAVVDGFYDTSDNKRVGSVLADISGLAGGIEWTVDLEWSDADHSLMRYVVRVAPRLGTAAGSAVATQWTMPGAVSSFSYIEDFGEETGANDTLALSSGEGDSKPMSTRYEATDLLASFARFERRFTPATSITSTTTLDQYAEADHAATRLGLTQLTITANLDAAPRVNRDWWLGDDIDVALTCDRFPRRLGADDYYEAGYTGRLRTVGWELDLDARTIVPRIKEAG